MGIKREAVGAEIRIQVPNSYNKRGASEWARAAKTILADIQRRADDTEDADWEVTYEKTCEFCGWEWGEDDDSPHNGGCCDEDAKNMPPEPPHA